MKVFFREFKGWAVGATLIGLAATFPAFAAEQPVREAALPVASPPPLPELPQLPEVEGGALIGRMQIHIARYEDTLPDLAREYGVGFVELKAANPTVDTWLPGAGTPILIPNAHLLPDAPHKGVVINIPEMRLYLFAPGGTVETYPIGIGREGWDTPIGTTRIVRKTKNPIWYPPASIRKEKPWLPASVPSSPDNPLGLRAFYLGWPGYLMHGTNTPYGVGRRASHGCIRLYEADVEKLYDRIPVGTTVTSVSQEVQAAWIDGALYVEVHPSLAQALELEAGAPMTPAVPPDLVATIIKAAPDTSGVDWDALNRAARERLGYPIKISR